MNSDTVVALAGIAGTLLGVVIAGNLTARTARATGVRQDRAEARQARRATYAALSTALVICANTVSSRMDGLIRTAQQDLDDPRRRFIEQASRTEALAANQLQAATDALGPVMVEGPDQVANLAADAVRHLRLWNERLDGWCDQPELEQPDVDSMILNQARFGREDEADTQAAVEAFNRECRRSLHPGEQNEVLFGRRRWWAFGR